MQIDADSQHEAPKTIPPIRCAHYLPAIRLSDGGLVRAAMDMCSILAARGHDIVILTSNPQDAPAGWLRGEPRAPRVACVGAPLPGLDVFPPRARRQADWLLADRSLLHVHGPWLPSNRQLARLASRRGIPYVVTLHGMLDDWSMSQKALKKNIYLRLVGKRFLERAAAVQCTAKGELAQAQRHLGGARPVVIPCAIDLAPFERLVERDRARAQFSWPDSRRHILFLGRLHPKKGVDLLLRAARELLTQKIPYHVIIAGTGDPSYEQSLRTLVKELDIGNIVDFLGLVTGDRKLSLYQAADVFVLPTSQENFGLVLPEAMACKTPVITTKGVDIWEELQQAGAIIVNHDPRAIAVAIRGLLDDLPRARMLGARGRQWVFEHFEMNRLASAYERMYADAIRQPN